MRLWRCVAGVLLLALLYSGVVFLAMSYTPEIHEQGREMCRLPSTSCDDHILRAMPWWVVRWGVILTPPFLLAVVVAVGRPPAGWGRRHGRRGTCCTETGPGSASQAQRGACSVSCRNSSRP